MQVIFLGTNGWFDTAAGNTVSVLVQSEEYDIIFDAGNGIAVQCLNRRQLLVEHGKTLENCLAGSHLAYYHDACLGGGVIVVALLDRFTRKPLSSA